MLDVIEAQTGQRETFRTDVLAGLALPQKAIPSRWLYDDRGSRLFEKITTLEEYYPTRTETEILKAYASQIARFCGPRAVILEYGAGAGIKTEILLHALDQPLLYVPIDIAGDFLKLSAARVDRRFPFIETRPVIADFTRDFDLPADLPEEVRRCAFFPGSTIGNLDRADAATFLKRMRRHVRDGGMAIIGFDLKKDIEVLRAAYDDALGITAAFNLNILNRMNRELGGDFPIDRFAHVVRWNAEEAAIEMHIRSVDARDVHVDGKRFPFLAGETIHTESSRKYDLETIERMVGDCGWKVSEIWTDARQLFAVVGLSAVAAIS